MRLPHVYLCLLVALSSVATAQTRLHETPATGIAGFGASFVIDGDRIVATRSGLSTMFPEPPNQTGAVMVYEKQDGEWTQLASLTPEDVTVSDLFGTGLAVSGDWMAVSAPMADAGCGAVYVYRRAGDSWNEVQKLGLANCSSPQHLGQALVFMGDHLIAGAPEFGEGWGMLVVYARDAAGVWAEARRLEGGADEANTGFGTILAANDGNLFAGTPLAGGTGVVHHFAGAMGPGTRVAPADTTLRFFGTSVSATDAEVYVGAPGLSMQSNSRPAPGAVVALRAAGSAWQEAATLRMDAADVEALSIGISSDFGFGHAVQAVGNELWVSSLLSGNTVGSLFVYRREDASGAWMRTQQLLEPRLPGFASFGDRIAASSRLALAVAPRSDFGNGRIYLIERGTSDAWSITTHLADTGRMLTAITGERTECQDGKVGEFSCADVDLMAFLPVADVGGSAGDIVNDLWGWTDPETEREYVVIGHSFSTSFVDISDPENPRLLGTMPATEGSKPNAWRDVKVYANHAFVVADGTGQHGMQVFDLTQLRGLEGEPKTFAQTAHYDGVASAHNVVINEDTGFAFIVGANGGGTTCGGGLHMVDIRDPRNPKFAGCFNDQSSTVSGRGYSHDAQCVIYKGPDEAFIGREICFGSNETALSIADVTEKANPVPLATVSFPDVSYAHQGWLTDDHRYFYMNDEGDELANELEGTRTIIWDVTELEDPVLAGFYFGETKASDHNLYVRDNLLYESNYVSGLRIMDISNPVAPREVGYIDTVPWGQNDPGYAGSWSNYPYFKSGVIPVSSIKEGLFLVRYTQELVP
ncbi:MAG: choice-of-anchor B family protein [Rhodothermales bacterium]|nr:choice-of-anchor B family protein [Rhodothermales bacterium]